MAPFSQLKTRGKRRGGGGKSKSRIRFTDPSQTTGSGEVFSRLKNFRLVAGTAAGH